MPTDERKIKDERTEQRSVSPDGRRTTDGRRIDGSVSPNSRPDRGQSRPPDQND